jgi:hypothetical protein
MDGSAKAVANREAGFGAMGHVAASEPSLAGRQGCEPWDVWQHRSPL